ncbi:hypothetical protein MON38_15900 [Hymenobacter sp. DH14]|uniref:Uncharacterized protein n=1 Tax=Hymenobacter cyanobacteriorum TaxID=2926463 RepID=A0A9X1VMM5_9BACT|nr:hypothetical protein [Hymenobacter cyanobacteriorum]MCI1188906.1 hypothetical protein [Hymenobacter cyanobacteriorum]
MTIAAILSTRSYLKASFYDLVYEWEEDLSKVLKISILNAFPLFRKLFINKLSRKFLAGAGIIDPVNNLVEKANVFRPFKGYYLVFEMGVNTQPNYSTSAKAIPAFIDLWKQTDIAAFEQTYRQCPLVLISSMEAVAYLKEQGCRLNLAHFPLSLSDRYKAEHGKIYKKKYDVVLAGRTNPVLSNYLQEFSNKYPNVEILRQQEVDGVLCYVSNLRGIIGEFKTREEYIELLRASKISFYSTPGIDGGEKRTGGFNPVTPRYLELLSAQCLILGRYPDNEETRFYQLDEVCPNVGSYAQFEALMLNYLEQSTVPLALYDSILQKHYTSCRAALLQELVRQLN